MREATITSPVYFVKGTYIRSNSSYEEVDYISEIDFELPYRIGATTAKHLARLSPVLSSYRLFTEDPGVQLREKCFIVPDSLYLEHTCVRQLQGRDEMVSRGYLWLYTEDDVALNYMAPAVRMLQLSRLTIVPSEQELEEARAHVLETVN